MLRALTGAFLSVLIIAAQLGSSLCVVVYAVAQDSLTEEYCVNKDIDACCKATCHITTVVQQSAEKDRSGHDAIPEWRVAEYVPADITLQEVYFSYFQVGSTAYTNSICAGYSVERWHPPQNAT